MSASPPRVLVVGAGRVGGAVARGLAARGWPVLVTARHRSELESFDDLRTEVLELGAGGAAPSESLERVSAFAADHVVVAVGGAGHEDGPLAELDPLTVELLLDSNLRPHLAAATTLLPALRGRPESTFLWINGGTALAPARGRGLASVTAAAQLMLKDVLAAENPDGPRVLTLAITAPVEVPHLDASLKGSVVSEAVASLLCGDEPQGATVLLGADGRPRRRT